MTYNREKTWGELYDQNQEKKTGEQDFRGFAELFAEKGMKNYDKGEKEFGHPDKPKQTGENFTYTKDPQKKLDLHGEIVADAPAKVERFLRECRELGLRFVIVVFGIGRSNPDGKSRLRPVVIGCLNELLENHRIRDFKTADPKDGGYGAVYVYLK